MKETISIWGSPNLLHSQKTKARSKSESPMEIRLRQADAPQMWRVKHGETWNMVKHGETIAMGAFADGNLDLTWFNHGKMGEN